MVRSMWNGMLGFGLVNIPVGMYPATRENQVAFHMLHKKDCGRVKNQRVCSVCGEKLDYDEIVKGYEYEKGEYVEVTPEDLKKVKPETTETIDIRGFVDLEDVDPLYFDVPYYLVPWKKSDKIYALFRDAMTKSGKVAVAKFVMRTREYLAIVRPHNDSLVLNTLHYADEVRAAEEAPSKSAEASSREMDMAIQIIESMEEEFDPSEFHDTYSEALNALVQKKLEGKDLTVKKETRKATNVLDLFSRLEASLKESRKSAQAETKDKPAARTKTAAKKPAAKSKRPATKTAAKTKTTKTKLKLVA